MASPLLQGKLHISGMDSRAAALARQWQLGLETIAFSYAPLLDDSAALPRTREEIHGISSLWLHGPFAELIPCAIDPLTRDVAMRRFRQALDAAQALGIRRMVFHGGFIPHVYFPEWYVEQSVWFWREFLRDVPADMTLALENVMEPSPETLVSIAAQIDDPRLGLCLDVGHANTCVSETPPMDWIVPMAPWLRHVHLHNNQGDTDLHAPLGEGNIPMRQIIDTVLQAAPEATFTIEIRTPCRRCTGWRRRGISRNRHDRSSIAAVYTGHPPGRPGGDGRGPETTGRACQTAGELGRAGGYVHPSGRHHRPGVPENGKMPCGGICRR